MVKPDAQLIAYHALLENARAMLHAAREERWDDLSALDRDREAHLKLLAEMDANPDLVSTAPADSELRTSLIQSILECDEQTQIIVRARHRELHEVLASMDNQRKLGDAYLGT